MSSLLEAFLYGLWNLLVFSVWVGRFHPDIADILPRFGGNFPVPDGWLDTLAANWGSFISAAVAGLGLAGLAGYIGRVSLHWLGERDSGRLGLLAEYGLGFGFLGSLVLGLGLVGLTFRMPHLTLVAVLAFPAIKEGRRICLYVIKRGMTGWMPDLPVVIRVMIGILMLFCLLGILNIEMGWDSLTYHLRLPSFYLYRHKIFDIWHNYYAFFPSQVEMVFMLGQAVQGDMLARLLNAGFGFLFLLVVARSARMAGVPPGWPLLIVCCSPLFLMEITRCYVDLGMAFFAATSVLLLLRWQATGSMPALLASGALAGWGMGSKIFLVILWFAVLFAFWPGFMRRGRGRGFLLWNAAVWPVLVPWLARNYLLRGNPAFPFLSSVMGLAAVRPGDHILPFEAISNLGTTVRSALSARLEAIIFDSGHIEGPMVPIFGGLLPFLFIKPAGDAGRVLRRLVLAYVAIWIVLFPEIRFLLPVIPAILVLTVDGLNAVASRTGRPGAWKSPVMIAGIFPGLLFACFLQWRDFQPLSMPLGLETAGQKIRRVIMPPPYTAYLADYVGERIPSGDRILFLCNFVSYYIDRECLTDFHFGTAKVTDIIREGRTADGIGRQLRRRGIRWLLMAGTGATGYSHIPGFFDVPCDGWLEWRRFMRERTEVDWQTNYYFLLRVTGKHKPRPLAVLPVYEALEYADGDKALQSGQYAGALREYSRPLPLLADVGSRWSRMGLALRGMGRYAEAAEYYGRAMDRGFRTPSTISGLAYCRYKMNRMDEAKLLAEEAWRLDPSPASTAILMAGIEAAERNYSAAISWTEEAIRRKPGSSQYLETRARLQELLRRH